MNDLNLVQFLESNRTQIGLFFNFISISVLLYAVFQSRKILKLKSDAEKEFAKAILLDKELLEQFRSIQKIDDYRAASDELIKHQDQLKKTLLGLNEGIIVQVKPALIQSSIENRKAYLMKLARLVNNLAKT